MQVENLLADLIKINTTNPPGNETAAARYLSDIFNRCGIDNRIIEPAPGRGTLVARYGNGPRRLLLLSHLDVVPAGDDWDFEPFGGEIRDGFVLGRGAMDCKNMVVAEAWVMMELARRQAKLNGTVIFVAAADEENGGEMGVGDLIRNHPEEIRADFCVNEGGLEPLTVNGKSICFVQVGEKGIAQAELSVRGRSAHGSTPGLGENAIIKIAPALQRLASYQPPLQVLPAIHELLDSLAPLYGISRADPADSLINRVEDPVFREYLRALTRMTVSPNVVQGGGRVNVVPDSCRAQVDIRILPGQDRRQVQDLLLQLAGPDITARFTSFHAPSFSPAEGSAFELVRTVLKETTGASMCLPCLSTGATDSRFLRGVGMPAYGVTPLKSDYDPELRSTIHGRNERIDVDSLRLTAGFFLNLVQAYLS